MTTNFHLFAKAVKDNIKEMSKADHMFVVDVERNELWDKYLAAFPLGTNPIFRERTEHDCSCCRHFIRDVGAIVTFDPNDWTYNTIWDVKDVPEPYQTVANILAGYVRSKFLSLPISDLFLHHETNIGIDHNYEMIDGKPHRWNHFSACINDKHVAAKKDIPTKLGRMRENVQVLTRSLDEITFDACETVLELIDQNSLYRGQEHRSIVQTLLTLKRQWVDVPGKAVWLWAARMGDNAKIRNTVIGTLLVDLSQDVELNRAIKSFEDKVAPANYKRSSAPVTKGMIKKAEEKVAELGLTEALQRRYAMLTDITANDILFANRSTARILDPTASAFAQLASKVPDKPKDLERVEEIGIQDFLTQVLPKAQQIEVLVENRHQANLVSLIAPANADAPQLLKWGNNFSWSYNGDVTDSMKERVKRAGGRVDGSLRFSIQWNDGKYFNGNDFDAHCVEPGDNHIFYPNAKQRHDSSGMLDVDIINPSRGKPAVENIIWTDKAKMPKGTYQMMVHCYANRNGTGGFAAEIEFGGKIYTFAHRQVVRQGQFVRVADIEHLGKGEFKITEHLISKHASQDIWGISTEKFQPVSVVMRSPNHWNGQHVGNEHVFFMIEGCKKPDSIRGLYNEFLRPDLNEHRKVFEILGNMLKAPYTPDQLSGVGFSTTKRDNVVVKVSGSFSRMLRVNF